MKRMISDLPYFDYAKAVVNGEIITSQYVKLACERTLRWLDRDDIEFRPNKVKKVIKFISNLKHYTGKSNGQPFILSGWQMNIVTNIFGFYYKNSNKRVIRNAYIEVGRKAGKTALLSAISLYCLLADRENGAEVDCIANSRLQAKILFDTASNFAQGLDKKGKYIKTLRNSIHFDATKSYMQVLSSDAKRLDGFNSSLFVEDELHEAPNSKLYDVLKSSQGMRENPLAICITSAGFNKFSFCYEMRKTAIEILKGVKEDDSQFSAIYCIDEDDDWTDEEVWIKANPNLDVTVTKDYLREQVIQAKNNSTLEVGVKTKNFGVWCDTKEVWIDDDTLLDVTDKLSIKDFSGEIAFGGVDLASVSDLTAVSLMIPKDDKLNFITKYYLPESALSDNSNAELYKYWQRNGWLTITPGNVCDYDYIIRDLLKANNSVILQKIGYDAYNATKWAIDAEMEGLPLEPYSQSIGNFNKPTKELERLIKCGKVIIDNNPITRFCFKNVRLKQDWNDNCKPIKETNQNKIDGVIAMIEALGIYLNEPHYNNEFFQI